MKTKNFKTNIDKDILHNYLIMGLQEGNVTQEFIENISIMIDIFDFDYKLILHIAIATNNIKVCEVILKKIKL